MSNRNREAAAAIDASATGYSSTRGPRRTDGTGGNSGELRLPHGIAADLRWFWNDAPGILGLKGVNLEPSTSGGGTDDTSKAEAAERYRRISRILDCLTRRRVRVLQRYHQDHVYRGLETFGTLAGVALLSRAADRLYRAEVPGRVNHNDFVAWMKALSARTVVWHKGAEDDRATKRAILTDSESELTSAAKDYEQNRFLLKLSDRAQGEAMKAMRRRGIDRYHPEEASNED